MAGGIEYGEKMKSRGGEKGFYCVELVDVGHISRFESPRVAPRGLRKMCELD